MNFKPYPKAKDTPSRRSRKGLRNSVYWFNHTLKRKQKSILRRERRGQNG